MNIAIANEGLWEIDEHTEYEYIDENKILVINLKEMGKNFIDDLKGCGLVHGDSLHNKIEKFTTGIYMDILDYALTYADEECIEVRYDLI